MLRELDAIRNNHHAKCANFSECFIQIEKINESLRLKSILVTLPWERWELYDVIYGKERKESRALKFKFLA